MWNEPERSKASAIPSGTVRAAIYCRLSKDDDLQGESASIANHDVFYKGQLTTLPENTS